VTHIDAETGELLDTDTLQPGHPKDEYGRPYGFPLWKDGPILGGVKWRDFVAKKREFQIR
jgi:hypothetical protein